MCAVVDRAWLSQARDVNDGLTGQAGFPAMAGVPAHLDLVVVTGVRRSEGDRRVSRRNFRREDERSEQRPKRRAQSGDGVEALLRLDRELGGFVARRTVVDIGLQAVAPD